MTYACVNLQYQLNAVCNLLFLLNFLVAHCFYYKESMHVVGLNLDLEVMQKFVKPNAGPQLQLNANERLNAIREP